MRKATSVEVGGRFVRNLCDFEQRLETGIDGTAQSIEAELGEDAILAGERNGVGDGGDRYHFHERQQQARLIFFRRGGAASILARL